MRKSVSPLFACGSGILFGLGLTVSEMVNPEKIQNFLDVFGTWDPSLAFVMGGAILVAMPGFRIVKSFEKPLCSETFNFPAKKKIESNLIIGGILFGAGWGISGYCPGPAITGLALFEPKTLIFVASMLVGMYLGNIATGLSFPGWRQQDQPRI